MLGRIKYQWKRLKNNNYVILIGIISLFLIVGGFSYALFTSSTERKGSLNIVTGEIVATIESESLDRNHSMSIKSGESKEIVITLKNENEVDAKFNFWYEVADGVNVSYDSTKDVPMREEGEVIRNNGVKTYRLKIANNTDKDEVITFGSNGGLYNKKLSFPSGKKIVEGIIPVVDTEANMIKVVWNESSSTWVKADNHNWYDYDFGKWANAVTVTTASRSKYQSATGGTPVPMRDIETMWVYIPRYSYTIGSEDGVNYYGKQGVYLSNAPTQALPGEIDVKFIKKSEKELGSAKYKVAEKRSGWRTPDGFTFGNDELSGIWVGKFETSSSNPSAQYGGGNVTDLDAMIKPNVISWRAIQVSYIAEVGRNITKNGNRYGFSSEKLNSHAMKNSEWALVAYLSQSKYGKVGNREFDNANKEIYQNKTDQYITGCSYGAPSNGNTNYGCQYTYDKNLSGTGASTTGTIYGIYDMSGGAWEYVMGNYAPKGEKHSGMNTAYHSGYEGLLSDGSSVAGKSWLEDKYYDFYTSSDSLTACNEKECIAHALNETAGWYGDNTLMVTVQFPWAVRGGYGNDGSGSGIFYSGATRGYIDLSESFRLVLSKS